MFWKHTRVSVRACLCVPPVEVCVPSAAARSRPDAPATSSRCSPAEKSNQHIQKLTQFNNYNHVRQGWKLKRHDETDRVFDSRHSSLLAKPAVYITHNATWPPEVAVCVKLSAVHRLQQEPSGKRRLAVETALRLIGLVRSWLVNVQTDLGLLESPLEPSFGSLHGQNLSLQLLHPLLKTLQVFGPSLKHKHTQDVIYNNVMCNNHIRTVFLEGHEDCEQIAADKLLSVSNLSDFLLVLLFLTSSSASCRSSFLSTSSLLLVLPVCLPFLL